MTAMCKFKVGDQVRSVEPDDYCYLKTGTVTERDSDYYLAYKVKFRDGDERYYAANHLTLAPTQGEYR